MGLASTVSYKLNHLDVEQLRASFPTLRYLWTRGDDLPAFIIRDKGDDTCPQSLQVLAGPTTLFRRAWRGDREGHWHN